MPVVSQPMGGRSLTFQPDDAQLRCETNWRERIPVNLPVEFHDIGLFSSVGEATVEAMCWYILFKCPQI